MLLLQKQILFVALCEQRSPSFQFYLPEFDIVDKRTHFFTFFLALVFLNSIKWAQKI